MSTSRLRQNVKSSSVGVEGLAQTLARGASADVGPEHADERIAAMGALGFDGEEGAQGARFVGFKGSERRIVQCDVQRTEKGERGAA